MHDIAKWIVTVPIVGKIDAKAVLKSPMGDGPLANVYSSRGNRSDSVERKNCPLKLQENSSVLGIP